MDVILARACWGPSSPGCSGYILLLCVSDLHLELPILFLGPLRHDVMVTDVGVCMWHETYLGKVNA